MAAFTAPKPGDSLHHVMIFFELSFLLDVIFKFFKSYTKDGETVPTIDLSKIARRYIYTTFIFDFIPLIPIPSLLEFHRDNHLYIIKCIRIINGFALFNVSEIMEEVRGFYQSQL